MTEAAAPPPSSRSLLLDAAEALMREEGYAAVTSRRVAAKAGLKPQLVHYHFKTMDDLFLELFQRLANEIKDRHAALDGEARPLRAMWNLLADSRYRLMVSEFVALGNHRKAVRTEFIRFGDEIRQMQIAVMERVLSSRKINGHPWTPPFAAILLHSLARFLSLEADLGVSEGHAEAQRTIDAFIDRIDAMNAPLEARMAELEAENAALRSKLGL